MESCRMRPEVFCSIKQVKMVAETWKLHDNTAQLSGTQATSAGRLQLRAFSPRTPQAHAVGSHPARTKMSVRSTERGPFLRQRERGRACDLASTHRRDHRRHWRYLWN